MKRSPVRSRKDLAGWQRDSPNHPESRIHVRQADLPLRLATFHSPPVRMKIEAVDFFYLSIPHVLDIGDGSQDALLVRVQAGVLTGWGECEAAPLPSIASWNCPMSH